MSNIIIVKQLYSHRLKLIKPANQTIKVVINTKGVKGDKGQDATVTPQSIWEAITFQPPVYFNSNGTLSISKATSTTDGYLSSTDWVLFNSNSLPSQTGNNGKFLTTNGTTTTWASVNSAVWGNITGTLSSQTDLQAALDNKLTKNSLITAGTATKITFDVKGLITSYTNATTSDISEGSSLYYTNARTIASVLTGYTSGAGTISSSDSILSAIQKLNGNISSLTTGVSNVFGTVNQISTSSSTGSITLSLPSTVHITGSMLIGATGGFQWGDNSTGGSIRGYMAANADGVFIISNSAANDFGRLILGGSTSSYPSIKRSGTGIQVRLADDSAYSTIYASSFITGGGTSTQYVKGDGSLDSNVYLTTAVSSVNGTTNRITVATGTTTPVIDISSTFEALLSKVANRIDQNNAITTSAQFLSIISDESGTGVLLTTNGSAASLTSFPTFNQDTTGYSSALKSATTTVNVSSATAPTSGQVLTATSSTAATWQTPSSGFSNPMTTLGDIMYEDATPQAARLAGNTTSTKKFLTQTGNGTISAVPGWNVIIAADIPDISSTYLSVSTASSSYQPLDSTLTAIASYNTNGIITQTAVDTFTGRTITGTTDKITVTNGSGVSGNPTITIASTYIGQSSITTLGTITTGIYQGTAIADTYISSSSNWNSAYNKKIVSGVYSAGTIILTQQDSGTVTITGVPQGTVTSVTGTSNRITSSGGATPVIDISASYVGQSSITTLGTVTTATLSTGTILAGVTITLGSDANYDTYYRNSSGVITRLANGTTGQLYTATNSAAPSWTTPISGTSGRIPKFTGTNTIGDSLLYDSGTILFYGTTTTTSQGSRVFFTGGGTGCNIDIRGNSGAFVDQSVVELEGNDYDTTTNSIMLLYRGNTFTSTDALTGLSNSRLGRLSWSGASNAAITTDNSTPIRFFINATEVGQVTTNGYKITTPSTNTTSTNIVVLNGSNELEKRTVASFGFGTGTVTSVALTAAPSWLTIGGSPITTSGTLTITATTGLTANQFLATPNGSTGAVSLRSIVAADVPTLNQNTTGSSATLTTGRTIGITGDVTYTSPSFDGSSNITASSTVTKINGTLLSGLATGILKNTTSTGVPSIAVAADFPTLNQNTTGSAATLTTSRNINDIAFNGSASIQVPSSQTLVNQASHGLSVGNIIKYSSSYLTAQADSAANAEAIGIVSTVVDSNNFILTSQGYVSTLSGLTANTEYYLSPSSAGALTATEPTAVGQISKPVFYAISTTAGYFINYRGMEITAVGTGLLAVSTKTTTYTVTSSDDYIRCDGSGGAFTVNLPTAVGISGRMYTFKKIDSSGNTITLDGNGSETIDLVTTKSLSVQNDFLRIISNGTGWDLI